MTKHELITTLLQIFPDNTNIIKMKEQIELDKVDLLLIQNKDLVEFENGERIIVYEFTKFKNKKSVRLNLGKYNSEIFTTDGMCRSGRLNRIIKVIKNDI